MSFPNLVKLSALLKYGLLGLLIGAGLSAYALIADNTMPERSALQTIEGTVTGASRVSVKRRRGGESIHYELKVATKDNPELKLKIPQAAMAELGIRRIIGQLTQFETDDGSDVFVVRSQGQALLSYEQSVKTRHASNSSLLSVGLALAGFAALIALLGYGLARRKARKLIAEWEAGQPPQQALGA